MIARSRALSRRTIEVGAVVAIYILFVIVGVYAGQTTMNVDMIGPANGAKLPSSPVELVARITIRGAPVANVTTIFNVQYRTVGQTDTESKTDNEGIARLLVPAMPGNYSWHVTAMMEEYPKTVSSSRSFSVKLLLVVEMLSPSTFTLAVSPVNFKARVTGMNGSAIQSANVTFYVDSVMIGSNLTGQNGIAQLSKALTMGQHTWFASADKEGEGGISDITLFVVGQLASFVTGDPIYELSDRQVCGTIWGGCRLLRNCARQGLEVRAPSKSSSDATERYTQ